MKLTFIPAHLTNKKMMKNLPTNLAINPLKVMSQRKIHLMILLLRKK